MVVMVSGTVHQMLLGQVIKQSSIGGSPEAGVNGGNGGEGCTAATLGLVLDTGDGALDQSDESIFRDIDQSDHSINDA